MREASVRRTVTDTDSYAFFVINWLMRGILKHKVFIMSHCGFKLLLFLSFVFWGNSTWANDASTINEDDDFSSIPQDTIMNVDGLLYQFADDGTGNPYAGLRLIGWAEEKEELNVPQDVDLNIIQLKRRGKSERNISPRETRRYKVIIWFVKYGKFLVNPQSIKKVDLPAEMKILGDKFRMLTGLAELKLPEGLKEVPDSSFMGCSSISNIVFPKELESIGCHAFEGCSNISALNLPNGLRNINYKAFAGCSSLRTLNIPSSISYIEPMAFADCTSLKSVAFDFDVFTIAYNAFKGCTSLAKFEIKRFNPVETCPGMRTDGIVLYDTSYRSSVGNPSFDSDPNKWVATICAPAATIVRLDPQTRAIGEKAFEDCQQLRAVFIPESAIYYENEIFKNCKALEKVSFVGQPKTLSFGMFMNCEKLKDFEMPAYVEEIKDSVFVNCKSLKRLSIPSFINKIGENSFTGSGIEKFDVDEFNSVFLNIGEDGAIYAKNNNNEFPYMLNCTALFRLPPAYKGTYIMPTEVEDFCIGALNSCNEVDTIKIKQSNIGWNGSLFKSLSTCKNLQYFEIEENNNGDGSQFQETVSDGKLLYRSKDRDCIIGSVGSISSIKFDNEGVAQGRSLILDSNSFYGNTNLSDITFDCSSRTICFYAPIFSKCNNIKSVKVIGDFPHNQSGITECFEENVYSDAILYLDSRLRDVYQWGVAQKYWYYKFKNVEWFDFGAVEETKTDIDNPKWRVSYGTIEFLNCEGSIKEIYNISGSMISTTNGNILTGINSGLYILRVGEYTSKVVIP